MKRSYLMMRKPRDDDDQDVYDYGEQELVRAKPIDARVTRNLGPSFSGGKDFVRGSERSQKEFYGSQTVVGEEARQSGSVQKGGGVRPMTHDERNKISANILKAELKGDLDRVKKLRNKLESGVIEFESESGNLSEKEKPNEVLLMNIDKRSGLIIPARSQKAESKQIDNSKRKGTVDTEFEKELELSQMIAEEKATTAEQQIAMFSRSTKICSESRVEDDWVVDDNIMSHPKKRRHEDKDIRRKTDTQIREHKFAERTLETCPKCIDSRLLAKHAIVATGIKTYLAVVDWDGLAPDHCYIAPMAHYVSSVVLDEDVYEEMKLWKKGLVAMWRDDDEQDCVFVESALNVREQRHMSIECIPLPKELGDMAPIYFKKAIMESEKEWSDNKKLIDLSKSSKHGIRGSVPKGFPYFAVDFGLQAGFAHVIENEKKFPANFAQEIVGGMLDMPHHHWRNPKHQSFDEIMTKRNHLQKKWATFDWTEIVKSELDDDNKNKEENKDDEEERETEQKN